MLAAIISSRSSRESARTGAALGSISALSSLERTVLAEPCSARYCEEGIRTAGSQCGQQPSDNQDKVISARQIEERLEGLNRAASLGEGQGQHPGRPTKAHRRTFDQPPSIGSDVDGMPVLVGKIEVDVAGVLCGADVDYTFRAVELRPRLEQIERRPDLRCTRSSPVAW